MSSYQVVIGLEVHLQSKTESKMFCSCPASYFGKGPNTLTCPTCLGLPGALPSMNKKALDHCIKLALALHCRINKESKFDRKNYFYPDLPKGYQISQYDLPIGEKGYIELDIDKDARRIRIERVHQEEDTGKTHHKGRYALLDYNKSGVPLIEIVSAPDFVSVEEVIEYAKELRRIVRYLDISDADMEKGQMRFELNISLKESGSKKLPDYKVEIKNIGSISVLEKVIRFEIERQSKLLDEGIKPAQETRGLRGMTGETVSQRIKEGSSDYRYFPEPDLPPIEIDDDWIEEVSEEIPELPRDKRTRFVKDYSLEMDVVKTISQTQKRADFFEKAVSGQDSEIISEIAKWFVGDFMRLMKKSKSSFANLKFLPSYFVDIVQLHKSNTISGTSAKQVLEEAFKTGIPPKVIVEKKDLKQIGSQDELESIVNKVISDNPKVVADYKSGKENSIQYLVGRVMGETKGKADPRLAEKMLREGLK